MTELKQYKCVNCGEPSDALYKTYGPSVLKLTKCKKCKNIVDKYIEYDPVIVMIDLVLMSREAQRHVLYNIEFKSYWKLLIILMMLETYGVWRNDSLFNMTINLACGPQRRFTDNSTHLSMPISIDVPKSWKNYCRAWAQDDKGDDNDLFIWEKDFYIQFLSIFSGIIIFIVTVHSLMRVLQTFKSQSKVPILRVLKAFSLANVSILFTLPMLVWGNVDTSPETRTLHYVLVFLYSFVVFVNMFTVLYECSTTTTVLILIISNVMKYATNFHMTPYLRNLVAMSHDR